MALLITPNGTSGNSWDTGTTRLAETDDWDKIPLEGQQYSFLVGIESGALEWTQSRLQGGTKANDFIMGDNCAQKNIKGRERKLEDPYLSRFLYDHPLYNI